MRASLRPLVATDVASAIAALLGVWLWGLTLAIYVHSRVTGFQPKESWGEVLAFDLLFSAAVGLLWWHRAGRVGEVLAHGARVPARVERELTHPPFTRVRLAYEWEGEPRQRDLLLWCGRRARALRVDQRVTLALLPAEPRRAVIADLHEPEPGAAPAGAPISG